MKAGQLTPANVADHITPHKGDATLFWTGSLQSLCAPHHDAAKQAEERRGYSGECDPDGWPIDPRHPANASQR
jgi:5-methylcytosine-specific restriction protein A